MEDIALALDAVWAAPPDPALAAIALADSLEELSLTSLVVELLQDTWTELVGFNGVKKGVSCIHASKGFLCLLRQVGVSSTNLC
jgi:hypothetical protein